MREPGEWHKNCKKMQPIWDEFQLGCEQINVLIRFHLIKGTLPHLLHAAYVFPELFHYVLQFTAVYY